MTVTGPLTPAEALALGPALCREWLLSDQSSLLERSPAGAVAAPGRPRPDELVELASLSAVRRWPLASLHNLHLSREDALRELCGPLKQRHQAGLVVVSTPRAFWAPRAAGERAAALQALSREAGVRLVAGTAPAPGRPASAAELEAEVASLLSDLAVGFEGAPAAAEEGRGRAGFLGELQLWDPAAGAPAASELLALRACVEAQRRSGAALLLSGPVSEEALAALEQGPCLWEKCVFFDVPPASPVPPELLLARGGLLGFCPPGGAADVAWAAYPGRRPWASEEAFLRGLAAAPRGRRLVGSGIRFRSDLGAFGGPGAAHALELLCAAGDAAGEAAGGAAAEGELRAAAVAALQYPWRPPVAPEEVIRSIACHWCGAWKVEGEHFSKFGFDYCAPKCIRKHAQVEYAPDKHER